MHNPNGEKKRWKLTIDDPVNATFRRSLRMRALAKELRHKGFRHSYMARQLKAFLASQIRALRGDSSQKDFGDRIGKPQSVVSRLEKQADRHISVQTLIDIAERLDIAVVIRFVDFPTFLRYTDDYSESALAPAQYSQTAVDIMAKDEERSEQESALKALFLLMPGQSLGQSAQNPVPPSQVTLGSIANSESRMAHANDTDLFPQQRGRSGYAEAEAAE